MQAFSVEARAGRARAGRLQTPHGTIETPVFMPVGTAGVVKAITHAQLRDLHEQFDLCPAVHGP